MVLPPVESVRRRYLVTLLAQFSRLAISVVTAGVAPRVLGPVVFGNYNFLLNAASTLRSFLEPSAQQAFFTFSSQERSSGSLTKIYTVFLCLQVILSFGLIALAVFLQVTDRFWPGQQVDQLLWITLLDWTMFFAISLQQLGDSKGLTVRPQVISAVVSALSAIVLIGFAVVGWLNFYTYVWLNLGAATLITLMLGQWLLGTHRELCWAGKWHIGNYVRRWWHYAAPLLVYEYYMPLISFLGVYLVQAWYGSLEQGYFALALRWSALVLVFTSAALSIFWREIAYWTAQKRRDMAAQIYQRFDRLLIFLAFTLAGWLAAISLILVPWLAGESYRAAVPVMMVMAFYPVTQTYGQLTTAAIKATERTAFYRNWSIAFSLPDIALTYLVVAPREFLGWNLGAIGIALKMVVYGFLCVQVFEWANYHFFNLNYKRALLEKLITGIWVGVSSVILSILLSMLSALHPVLSLSSASLLYFSLIGLGVWLRPNFIGTSRKEIFSLARSLAQKLSKND